MGFRAASTFADALEMAADTVGRAPSISYLHNPRSCWPTCMSESPVDDLRLLARGWRWTRRPLAPDALGQQGSAFDTGWARAPLARAVRESALGGALGPLLRSSLDVSVAGREQLDAIQPPVVFVANHASHLDGLLVLDALPGAWRQKTVVAAASDYFFDAWWRSIMAALVLNAVPLERFSGAHKQTQLASLVASGWSVLAFPEGTRSRDGTLQRIHHGPAQLALETGRPIVPVAIRGTFLAMPVGARWPRHTRVAVRFGPADPPARCTYSRPDRTRGWRVAHAPPRGRDYVGQARSALGRGLIPLYARRVGGEYGQVRRRCRPRVTLPSGAPDRVDVPRAWWNTRGPVQPASFALRLEAVVRGFDTPAGRLPRSRACPSKSRVVNSWRSSANPAAARACSCGCLAAWTL